jgi:phage terminase large subunit-like protein
VILIEDKASGTQLIQELKNNGITVKPFTPTCNIDKVVRLSTVTDFFHGGQVLLPREAHWLSDYVSELTGFPGAKYDDQVDSTTQFLDHMRNAPRPLDLEALSKAVENLSTHRRNQFYNSWSYGPFFRRSC